MITASIVVHKTPWKQLKKALDCLILSDINKIYIVDNSPTDKLKDIVKKYKNTEYLKVPNKGFGAGHNIAIRMAEKINSDYHLVMNADIYWDGNIITNLKRFMDLNPEVGLVSPKVFYPDGMLQYTCRKLPTPGDLFFKRFLPSVFKKRKMAEYLLEDHDHDYAINCPYLLGSFMFFKTKILIETGLFDERFFMYPEDIDITRRIHEKYKTIYWPSVSIVHEHQAASRKNLKMFAIHFYNMIKYFNKWGWIKDEKRKKFNKRLEASLVELKENKIQKGRG